jgi:predicted secreted protein
VGDLVLDTSADGAEYAVPLGSSLELRLPEIGSAGYRWQLRTSGPGLRVESDGVIGSGPGVGGAGRRRFVLVAERPGRVVVRAELRRPWQRSVPAEQSLAFTVEVEG